MPEIHDIVNECVAKIKKRKVEGSQATARLTAELFRSVISMQKLPPTNQAFALIEAVKSIGEKLVAANPVELAIGNIVRRILHIIREEDLSVLISDAGDSNLSAGSDDESKGDMPNSAAACHITSGEDSEEKGKLDKYARSRKLKHDVIEAVNMLIEDIDICHGQIAEQAVEHIHQNEVILTLGHSRTVLEFLCAAKEKKRSFQVFVAEGAPRYQGQVLAKQLIGRGLQTTVITDSAVFAMISRVNMVIVGVHAVMANGGVIAPVGLNIVALAARKYNVPFVVVAAIHKLCPSYPHNPEVSLNDMRSPHELLEFGTFSDCVDFESGISAPLLHIVNPAFDYVPPELVTLLITDVGGYTPSNVHLLIADHYSADDLLSKQKSAA